jgi:subtilisin family serine protease
VDALNRYIWAGGATDLPTAFDETKMSWGHQQYNIPGIWHDLNLAGQGVTVALIDTGVASHPDLDDNVLPTSADFTGGNIQYKDTVGHGTNMAGIIAATGKQFVYGVAPGAKLLVLKASTEEKNTDAPFFIPAINHAASLPEVDIISISFSFLNRDPLTSLLPKFIEAVNAALTAGKIVVAAIGDVRSVVDPSDEDTYPSSITNLPPDTSMVLSVGSFASNGDLWGNSEFNKHLCVLAPGDDNIKTTGLNGGTDKGSDTSIATAFLSGCLALILSYTKIKQIKNSAVIQAIFDTCIPLPNPPNPQISFGFGKLDLPNVINKIKTL